MGGDAYSKEKRIYSYALKANVQFPKVLNEVSTTFILIDENCSLCKALILDKRIKNKKGIALAVVTNPSFSWLAKLKRQGIGNMLYNIKPLGIDVSAGTPQIIQFNLKGQKTLQLYGKSKIIQHVSTSL
ncbi:MAG: hypothetical protein ACPGJV_15265 [Bacteriovoracaceae bacterium]